MRILSGGSVSSRPRRRKGRRAFLAFRVEERLERGEELVIFDIRHPLEFQAEPQVILGAVYAPLDRWKEEDYARLKDKEVIVYCA